MASTHAAARASRLKGGREKKDEFMRGDRGCSSSERIACLSVEDVVRNPDKLRHLGAVTSPRSNMPPNSTTLFLNS